MNDIKKIFVLFSFITSSCIYLNAQTKELRVEDGYEWFLISQGGKYGIESFNEILLLDVSYDTIKYDNINKGGFYVGRNGAMGYFNIDGKCIIPLERKYKCLIKTDRESPIGTYYTALKAEGGIVFCNKKGEEVAFLNESSDYQYDDLSPSYEYGYFYYQVALQKDNLIINGDGDIIYRSNEFIFLDFGNYNKPGYFFYLDKYDKFKYLGPIKKVKTNYNPFNGNGNDSFEKLCASIGYAPFKGKIRKIEDESDGKIRYMYEYDRLKGLRSLTGKWVVPMCHDYKAVKIGNKMFYRIKDNQSHYGLYSVNGEKLLDTKYNAIESFSDNYVKVRKKELWGLFSIKGEEIIPCEMEALESAGTGYLKYKINGFWGVMNYAGKIIIDTDRGYTSIGNFVTFTKRFPYTMTGYKGECDINGKQISKIKVETPQQTVTTQTTTTTTPQRQEEQKIIIEHKHDPIPVNVWVQCNICGGSGRCQTCGGSGIYTGPAGNKTLCSFGCGGSGKCSFCAGSGGHYEVEYK